MRKKILSIAGTVVLVILVLLVVMMFFVRFTGGTPNIFGYQVFRVSSDSMEPVLNVTDVILVRNTDPADIRSGDIVTYRGTSGQVAGMIITHKVVQEPDVDENGVYHFQTQGIREGASLDPPITGDQLLGKYICTIPLINYLYSFFLSPFGLITFLLVLVVAFGSELISLVLIFKEKTDDDDIIQEFSDKELPEGTEISDVSDSSNAEKVASQQNSDDKKE